MKANISSIDLGKSKDFTAFIEYQIKDGSMIIKKVKVIRRESSEQ